MYLYQRSIFYIHTHKYNCMQSNASTVKMHEREGATHRIFGVWRRNCQSKIQHRTTTKNDAVTKWTVVIEHLLFCIDVSIRWFFCLQFSIVFILESIVVYISLLHAPIFPLFQCSDERHDISNEHAFFMSLFLWLIKKKEMENGFYWERQHLKTYFFKSRVDKMEWS